MKGHSLAHRDADRGNLAVPNPYPGPGRGATRANGKFLQRRDGYLLELSQVGMHGLTQGRTEIHDRISDHLSRTVVGDIAAAGGADKGNRPLMEEVLLLAGSSQGENMGVFEEQ